MKNFEGYDCGKKDKGASRVVAGKINGMIGVGHQERALCDCSRIIIHTVFVLKIGLDTAYLPSNKITPPPPPP